MTFLVFSSIQELHAVNDDVIMVVVSVMVAVVVIIIVVVVILEGIIENSDLKVRIWLIVQLIMEIIIPTVRFLLAAKKYSAIDVFMCH